MTLQANAVMTFTGYDVEDSGIRLRFVCFFPGAGEPNDYDVMVTDAELVGVVSQLQLRTLVLNKLKRKLRAETVAALLDQFIGQSITI